MDWKSKSLENKKENDELLNRERYVYRNWTGSGNFWPDLELILIFRYEKKKKKRQKRLQREHTRKTILWVSKFNVH